MSFNKITIVGNLGKDPELRYTPQGTPVTSFTVATNEKRKDKSGEMVDKTTWFKATMFGRQAEIASQYLQKGRPVYLEGRLTLDEWTGNDGEKRQDLAVAVTDMKLIDGGNGGNARQTTTTTKRTSEGGSDTELSDDDIPF